MKRYAIITLILGIAAGFAHAAPTTAVLGGGICINEVMPDPNGGVGGFDTDGNGTISTDQTDEFLELYNMSGGSIDISGWGLYDPNPAGASVTNPWFVFPASTVVPAGGRVFVIQNVQAGGTLPANGFNAGIPFGGGILNNGGGDNIVLHNPTANQYIQASYSDAVGDTFSAYPNFPAGATQVGTTENFVGARFDGESYVRVPEGDTATFRHSTVATANASPGTATPLLPDDPNAQFNATIAFGVVATSTTKTISFNVANSPSSSVNLDITGFNPVSGNTAGYTFLTSFPVNGIVPGASTSISVQVTAPGADNPTFDAVFDLVSNDDSSPDPITFTTNAATPADVPDIATARGVGDTAFIRITGAATLSCDPDAFGGATIGGVAYRIFPVQDTTGALLLLEPEANPVFTAALDAGSVVTGIIGEKERFQTPAASGNFLEEIFVTGYTTQVDGGAVLTPAVITIADLNASVDTYESELIQLNSVSTTSTGNWTAATLYDFTDGTNTAIVRMESARSGLNGTPLPVGSTTLVGIGDAFGPDSQLAPLASGDLSAGAAAAAWNLFE